MVQFITPTATSHGDNVLAQINSLRQNTTLVGSSSATCKNNNILAPSSPPPPPPSSSRGRQVISDSIQSGIQKLEFQRQQAIVYAKTRAEQSLALATNRFLDQSQQAFQRKDLLLENESKLKLQRLEMVKRDQLRSGGFGQSVSTVVQQRQKQQPHQPPQQQEAEAENNNNNAPQRDEYLALIEKLEPGPRDLSPAKRTDPEWLKFEPYSGTKLRARDLSHQDLTEYLTLRYHLTPSLLYSVVKPINRFARSSMDAFSQGPDGDYQVPVDGDWVVLAVIVEKGDVRMSNPKTDAHLIDSKSSGSRCNGNEAELIQFKQASRGVGDKLDLGLDSIMGNNNNDGNNNQGWHSKRKTAKPTEDEIREMEEHKLANRPRKYQRIKLVDLTVYDQRQANGTSGDRVLSLLSYEADQVDTGIKGTHRLAVRSEVQAHLEAMDHAKKRVWTNGSKGAFELLHKQMEGTLIAIMNPKILKPYKKGGSSNDPVSGSQILTLSPRSADDILVIGRASDYARCEAIKKDQNRCTSFVDRRTLAVSRSKSGRTPCVCEFHLNQSINSIGRSRMEFAVNSSSIHPPGYRGGGGGFGSKYNNKHHDSSASASKAWFQKKLNFPNVSMSDGMSSNSGKTYTLDSTSSLKPSDPSCWKFDISKRFGRGRCENQSRLEKAKNQDLYQFQTNSNSSSSSLVRLKRKIPDSSTTTEPTPPPASDLATQMLSQAFQTLEQRKSKAKQDRLLVSKKRRKYNVGLVEFESSDSDLDSDCQKKKHKKSSIISKHPITTVPPSSSSSSTTTSSSILLSRFYQKSPIVEPDLRIKKQHRPKYGYLARLENEKQQIDDQIQLELNRDDQEDDDDDDGLEII